MRLTACIPDIDQSSPHHKLPGGCISANGGLFTESEKSVINVSFQSRPLTIIDFGMMNGLVTLISVACSRWLGVTDGNQFKVERIPTPLTRAKQRHRERSNGISAGQRLLQQSVKYCDLKLTLMGSMFVTCVRYVTLIY